MQEININQSKKEIEEEPNLSQKVETMWSEQNVVKRKDMKLIRKAKVRKRKIKKGWIGILKIDENNNISGEKVQLRDASFKLKDGLFHATEGDEILWWEGKFPILIQESKKINPKNFKFNQGNNETYGQPYIQAKMLQEAIKPKGGGLSIILWLIGIGAAIFLISKLLGH